MMRYGNPLKPLHAKVKALPSIKGYSPKKFRENYAKAKKLD